MWVFLLSAKLLRPFSFDGSVIDKQVFSAKK